MKLRHKAPVVLGIAAVVSAVATPAQALSVRPAVERPAMFGTPNLCRPVTTPAGEHLLLCPSWKIVHSRLAAWRLTQQGYVCRVLPTRGAYRNHTLTRRVTPVFICKGVQIINRNPEGGNL